MKLEADSFAVLTIKSYTIANPALQQVDSVWIQGDDKPLTSSVLLTSDGQRIQWSCTAFEQLTSKHFDALGRITPLPELVIFGTGQRLRFPAPELLRSLMAMRIGLETMDTGAACRTYNILAGEGRSVALALLMTTA